MSKTLEGMAQAAWERRDVGSWSYVGDGAKRVLCDDQRAALLWLAANVSDEMSIAAVVDWQNDKGGGTLQEWLQSAISAALRAAAGGG